MHNVIYKVSPVTIVLCLLVLIPVFILMGLGIKAIDSEKISQEHRQQSEASYKLLQIEQELKELFLKAREEQQEEVAVYAHDYRVLRELMYLSDPFELVMVSSIEGEEVIRAFPPDAVAGIITEQQQLNRYREEIKALQIQLKESPDKDHIQNVNSDQGETVLNCWNTQADQLCVVFNRAWIVRTIKDALRDLNNHSTIAPEGKFSLVEVSSHLSQYHTQVRGYHSQRHAMSFPFADWELELTVDSETLTDNQMIMYVSMIIPVVFFMMFMAFWLYRQQQQAEKEVAAKVEFTAELSHELRTPLANIRLYITLIQLQSKDDNLTQYCNILDSETERLSRLVDNAMLLARPEQHDVAHFLEVVPNQLIESILTTLSPLMLKSGNEVVTDLQTSNPVVIDTAGLERVMINLLDNSCKYAPNSLITIKSWQVDNILHLHIEDQGNGIDPKIRSSLFTPYQTSRHRVDGFGLGLAVCQRLMKRAKGEIELLPSEKGQGAVFQMRFSIQHKSILDNPEVLSKVDNEDLVSG